MKRDAAQSNTELAPGTESIRTRKHRRPTYQRAFDERKRPIRGLWVRNGRYYAQLTIEDEHTGEKGVRRIPLEGVTTAAQARDKMEDLRVDRRKAQLPVLRRTPKFAEYADQYLDYHRKVKDAKRPSTIETETYALERWKKHLGHVRLDKITRALVNSYIAKRKTAGRSGRTVNLEVTAFRNVMNRAIDDKWLTRLPTENLRPLKWKPRKRELVAATDMEKICSIGFQPIFFGDRLAGDGEKGRPLQNAQQFSDYIKLMSYCGSRMSETLRLKWSDVDWQNRQLVIGSDGLTKNYESRVVDFNQKLEAHLKYMDSRRAPDSEWLFPSPRRGDTDRQAKTFRESLILARMAAGMPRFGFHDCRHHFISICVMSGIDYMTIARWVGHRDGGILIGKVYGHLSNEHAKRQAGRLRFDSAD